MKGYDVDHKIDEKAEEPGPEKQRKRKVRYQESATSHAAGGLQNAAARH